MVAASEGQRISQRKCILEIEYACAVARRAKAKTAPDVAVASDVDLSKIRHLGSEWVFDAEIGIVEIGDRNCIVAVAEEPGPELVNHSWAEDLHISKRKRPLIGCLFLLKTRQRICGSERIPARLV